MSICGLGANCSVCPRGDAAAYMLSPIGTYLGTYNLLSETSRFNEGWYQMYHANAASLPPHLGQADQVKADRVSAHVSELKEIVTYTFQNIVKHNSDSFFNPRTAGGLSHLRTAGGTYVPPV